MRKAIFGMAVMALLAVGCQNTPTPTNDSAQVVMNTILQRKSVRSYTSDTIATDVMENLLRAAMAAPSGRNIQPWSFVVLTDKNQYGDIFGNNFNLRKS